MLVCTADNEAKWLAARKQYVTSTEMVVVLGMQPDFWSTTREQLIQQKRTGEDGFKANRAMLNGSLCEKGNMAAFGDIMGCHIKQANEFHVRDLDVDDEPAPRNRIAASIDGYIWPPDKEMKYGYSSDDEVLNAVWWQLKHMKTEHGPEYRGLLEAKQSKGWRGQVEQWAVAPPEYYTIQVQTQLYCTGAPYSVIFCRLGVDNWSGHVILPDEFLWEQMEEATEVFWKEVNDGE